MDRIDQAILSNLQQDARISNVDLAQNVGLSASACLRRVAALEREGVIDGYSANLNLDTLGYSVLVLVRITLQGQSAHMMKEFEEAVLKIPQVMACFLLAGEDDYLLRIATKDVNDYGNIHTTYLSALPHVLRMESNFVLRTVTNRGLMTDEI